MTRILIVSGGQTGAQQGSLLAARDLGLPVAGWAPNGWRTEAGSAPWLADFGLREHPSPDYEDRIRANVAACDRLLWMGSTSTWDARLTLSEARKQRVKHLIFERAEDFDRIAAVLRNGWLPDPVTLLVSGNREGLFPGTTQCVRHQLTLLLRPLLR